MSEPACEPSLAFRFARNRLDRRSDLRDDAEAIARLFARPDARFVVLAGDRPIVTRTAGERPTALHDRAAVERLAARPETAVFLGLAGAAESPAVPWFALRCGLDEDRLAALVDDDVADLRSIAVAGSLEADEYGALAQARAVLHWHATHGFCARCGAPSTIASAGWKRVCAACGGEHFPRTDPVVIMLITDGERCLLGRAPRFAPGMWSALAGFMEPGETVEAAVRRETREEAGIEVGRVSYFASEPWPFPASLMIGTIGAALTREIRRDPVELEDCRWFDRAEVAHLLAGTHPDGLSAPPPIAIARHLMAHFLTGFGCAPSR